MKKCYLLFSLLMLGNYYAFPQSQTNDRAEWEELDKLVEAA